MRRHREPLLARTATPLLMLLLYAQTAEAHVHKGEATSFVKKALLV